MNHFIYYFLVESFFLLKIQTEVHQWFVPFASRHGVCISRTPPKRAFDYAHCALRIPSFDVALIFKCYNRPSVSRLSVSSFSEWRGKRVLLLCRGRSFYFPSRERERYVT